MTAILEGISMAYTLIIVLYNAWDIKVREYLFSFAELGENQNISNSSQLCILVWRKQETIYTIIYILLVDFKIVKWHFFALFFFLDPIASS